MEENNIKSNKEKHEILGVLFDEVGKKFLIPLANMLFTFMIFNIIFSFTEYGRLSPLTMADIYFSMTLGVISYMLLLGVFGSTFLATLVYDVIVCLLMFVNKLKIMYVGEPLYFSDIKFLTNIIDLGKLAFGNLSSKALLEPIIPTLYMAVWAAALIILNKKHNLKISIKVRIVLIIINLGVCLFLAHPNESLIINLNRDVYKIESYEDYNTYVDDKSYYFYYGFVNGLYGNYINKIFFEPEKYNETQVDEALKNSNIESTSLYGKPNIILWFSESFFDIQQLDGVKFQEDPIPNFREYSKEGKEINMLSPSYGGASENVAFEVLTGGSMRYFPTGYIPVMSLYDTAASSENPSIVRELKKDGYKTSYIFGKDFYNSENAYINIGFDSYVDLSKNNSDVSDSLITKEVINLLKNKDTQFITVASYEAHMPYRSDKYDEYHLGKLTSAYSEEENETIIAYTEAIHRADEELKVLYEYIQELEEPTIIIFVPDHLPYLYTSNHENLMDNYIIREDGKENLAKKYLNKGLLLSNYDLDFSEIPAFIGADQLLNSIVQQTEVDLGSYYDYIYSKLDIYSGMNRYVLVKENGDIYTEFSKLMKEQKVNKVRRDMQYKLFINN